MYCVYVLKSDSGIIYIGQTKDLEKRLSDHNNGKSFFTKRCKVWTLVFKEIFNTRSEAMKREKFLKTGKGREFVSSFFASA